MAAREREEKWIRWVTSFLRSDSRRIRVGPGDDCAVLGAGREGELVVTSDMLVGGVHFDLDVASPTRIGWKAMGVNLSDVAAMGCYPLAATVTLAMPANGDLQWLRRVVRGMKRAADRFGVSIVGGDFNRSPASFAVSVTLIGETRGLKPVRRSGAKVGDAVFVTGSLGGSLLGKHLRFTPRIEEGLHLNRWFRIHSMIDLSDGLSTDLDHLLRASGVGALLKRDSIPLSGAARRLSRRTKRDPVDHALHDGEDFELLFTVSAREATRLMKDKKMRPIVTRIGSITGSGFFLEDREGRRRRVRPSGYEH